MLYGYSAAEKKPNCMCKSKRLDKEQESKSSIKSQRIKGLLAAKTGEPMDYCT